MQAIVQSTKGHWQLILLTALIAALWQTPAVQPLKILVVFLHELSHAATTLLTGGSVVSLTIDPQEGGMVLSRGGTRFLILCAGYIGSLLIGAALFLIAIRTAYDRILLGFLGTVLLLVTAFYIREGFAFGFGLLFGVVLLAVSKYLQRELCDLILRVIGLTSMIYAPLDIFSDTIARSHLRSDARMLAEEFGGTTLVWGIAWLVISLVVIGLSLRYGVGGESNIRWRGSEGSDGPQR